MRTWNAGVLFHGTAGGKATGRIAGADPGTLRATGPRSAPAPRGVAPARGAAGLDHGGRCLFRPRGLLPRRHRGDRGGLRGGGRRRVGGRLPDLFAQPDCLARLAADPRADPDLEHAGAGGRRRRLRRGEDGRQPRRPRDAGPGQRAACGAKCRFTTSLRTRPTGRASRSWPTSSRPRRPSPGLRRARLGLLGYPFPGMGDFAVDTTHLAATLGCTWESLGGRGVQPAGRRGAAGKQSPNWPPSTAAPMPWPTTWPTPTWRPRRGRRSRSAPWWPNAACRRSATSSWPSARTSGR